MADFTFEYNCRYRQNPNIISPSNLDILPIMCYAIQVFAAGFALPEKNQFRQNRFVTDSRHFLSDFCFLRCRFAGASQDEKGEKCRKEALPGNMGSNPVSLCRKTQKAPAFLQQYEGKNPGKRYGNG